MNRQIIIAFAAILGLGLTGCSNLTSKSKLPVQPQNQLARQGDADVSFSVVVPQGKKVSYQWQFNGSNILRATQATYTIIHPLDFSDVGEYRVLLREGDKASISQTAYLSVYSVTMQGNVNSGTLCTPVGQFGPQSYSCGNATFQRGYTPINAAGLPMLFYGPKATSQSGLFTNPMNPSDPPGSTLVVDTFSADNGSADTGLRIQNNWAPFATARCNDNHPGGTNPKQSWFQIPLSQNAGGVNNKNTYRLTVFYKVPPGVVPSRRVTLHWHYQ